MESADTLEQCPSIIYAPTSHLIQTCALILNGSKPENTHSNQPKFDATRLWVAYQDQGGD